MTYRNTREIEATYTKDDANLVVRLLFPDTYPLEYSLSDPV